MPKAFGNKRIPNDLAAGLRADTSVGLVEPPGRGGAAGLSVRGGLDVAHAARIEMSDILTQRCRIWAQGSTTQPLMFNRLPAPQHDGVLEKRHSDNDRV